MQPILGISSGQHRVADTLVRESLAAATGGLNALLIREPLLDVSVLPAVIPRLAETFRSLIVHLKTPGAAAVARQFGVGLHLPSTENVSVWADGYETLGISTHSVAEALAALEHGASYVLLSPVFRPTSKPNDTRAVLGLEGLEGVRGLPVWALGGILPTNAARVMRAGFAGIAVLGGLFGQPDHATIESAARAYVDAIAPTSLT